MKAILILGILAATSSYADTMKINCDSADQILATQSAVFEKAVGSAHQQVNQMIFQVLQQARQQIQQECLNQNAGQTQQKPIEY